MASWLSRFRPSAAIDQARAHPWQTAASAGLGLLAGAFGGPLAGQAATQGLTSMFNRRNDGNFQSSMSQMNADTNARLNQQIWGGGRSSAIPSITSHSPSNALLDDLGIIDWSKPSGGSGSGGPPSQGRSNYLGNISSGSAGDPRTLFLMRTGQI